MTILDLLDDIEKHLLADATLTAKVRKGVYHGVPPEGASPPYLLYSIPRADHEYGMGSPDAGQTSDVTLTIDVVDEKADSTVSIAAIAALVHVLALSWDAPAGWAVRSRTLDGERSDAFQDAGRRYQTATLRYVFVLERV